MHATRDLDINLIRLDGGTQSRVIINEGYIAELMEFREKLPPPIVLFDGIEYWLGDGFHRVLMHLRAGAKTIKCAIRHGTKRDAIKYSLDCNARHGLQRTRDDKEKAVRMCLADDEWKALSDRGIADLCWVSHTFVGRIRNGETSGEAAKKSAERTAKKSGNIATLPEPELETELETESGNVATTDTDSESETETSTETVSAPTPADPEKPWSGFETKMREQMGILRGVANSLRDLLEYDSGTKQLRSPWAHYYSFGGTVGWINAVIRSLGDGIPFEPSISEGPHGYISAHRVEVKKQLKVA